MAARLSPLALLLPLVLGGAMIVLVTTLVGECHAGGRVLGRYHASIRAGAAVTPALGGAEAPSLTQRLREAASLQVDNFHSQSGTSCYWVTLRGRHGESALQAVLDQENTRVSALSARRSCECPEDADLPCALQD